MEYMKARYEVKTDAAQPKVARQPKKLEHTWGKYVDSVIPFCLMAWYSCYSSLGKKATIHQLTTS